MTISGDSTPKARIQIYIPQIIHDRAAEIADREQMSLSELNRAIYLMGLAQYSREHSDRFPSLPQKKPPENQEASTDV